MIKNIVTLNFDIEKSKEDHIANVYRKKDELFYEALSSFNITLDNDLEVKRRFKSIEINMKRIDSNVTQTTYYYNDGTLDGLRVITIEEKIERDSLHGIIGTTLSYY